MPLTDKPYADGASRLWDSADLVKANIASNRRTLDTWASRGGGPPYLKIGRRRLYDPADVLAWLESRRVAS